MNKLESLVYSFLRNNPMLKNKVRDIYQALLSIVPVKPVESDYRIVNRKGYYFGFHDKSPFSTDDSMLLAHKYSGNDNELPGTDDWVEVGYFYGDEYHKFEPMSRTYAWNWSQGAMLQWVGQTGSFIFNDFDGNNHVAKIMDTTGSLKATIPRPVGAVNPDGKKALSYDFTRLRIGMPGYGYANGSDPDQDILIPDRKGSGLHIIDLESGESRELFTVADIASIEPEPSMVDAFHYFTHCLFSPSGNRFAFFHRWLVNNNQRYTRMITSDLSGKELFIFPTYEMVSHFAWKDDSHILAYARTKEYDDKYYLFKDKTEEFEIIGDHCFSSDGHPQFSPDGKYLLTDTYPDRFGRQFLILYNLEKGQRKDIARLRIPLKYIKGTRCDFHPRWNRKGDMICFDSAHTGMRSLCTISLSE